MEKEKKGLTKKYWYTCLVLIIVFVIIYLLGFYFFNNRKIKEIDKTEKGGTITLNYVGDSTKIKVVDLTPTSDSFGVKKSNDGDYYDFSVDVNLDKASSVEYEIAIVKDDKNSTISDEDIRIYLEKENSGSYSKVFGPEKYVKLKEKSKLSSPKGSMVLVNTKSIKSNSDKYRLRVWLSDKTILEKGSFSFDILVNGVAK